MSRCVGDEGRVVDGWTGSGWHLMHHAASLARKSYAHPAVTDNSTAWLMSSLYLYVRPSRLVRVRRMSRCVGDEGRVVDGWTGSGNGDAEKVTAVMTR
jgi:hypothetical protein